MGLSPEELFLCSVFFLVSPWLAFSALPTALGLPAGGGFGPSGLWFSWLRVDGELYHPLSTAERQLCATHGLCSREA